MNHNYTALGIYLKFRFLTFKDFEPLLCLLFRHLLSAYIELSRCAAHSVSFSVPRFVMQEKVDENALLQNDLLKMQAITQKDRLLLETLKVLWC